MPEIKNTFTQGKMNKDLDERIIPNGQYRDALNVKVSVSDDSSVGTVQNVLGNERLENIVPATYKCVGSISNEKTNKLYWFVTKTNVKELTGDWHGWRETSKPIFTIQRRMRSWVQL